MVRRHGIRIGAASGFTLMEVMFAVLILAFSVAALTQAIVSGQSHTYEAMHASRAIELAEAMIDEVLSKPYVDPDGDTTEGPDTDENQRDEFDCADDYDGYAEAAGGIVDQSLASYPDAYQKFSLSVSAEYTTLSVSELGGDHDGLNVTVTVTDQFGRTWSLSRFIPEPVS